MTAERFTEAATARIVGEIMAGAKPEHLGTDPVGRGAGWRKTNNALSVTRALWDVKERTGMSGGELFGALVENVIAAIQGSCAPSEWSQVGEEVAARIQRRMMVR